jgi:hypothetical protein
MYLINDLLLHKHHKYFILHTVPLKGHYYDPYINVGVGFNESTRHTRNMSYDLRGDVPIPYMMNLPFNMPESIPIRNKTLNDIS